MLKDEDIGKIMRRAFEKKIDGSELRMLLAIANGMNDRGYCSVPNNVFSNWLASEGKPASVRAITEWISELKRKGIVNVIINKHKHERRIYIPGFSKYTAEPSVEEMTEAQIQFHDAFPGRAIDCDVPESVDMPKLITNIRRSKFLRNAHNMSLKSCCIKYYKQIMAGWIDADKMPSEENDEAIRDAKRLGVA